MTRQFSFWAHLHTIVLNRGKCPNCGASRLYENGYTDKTHETRRYTCYSCGKSYKLAALQPLTHKTIGKFQEGNIWTNPENASGDDWPFSPEEEQAIMNEDRRPEGLKRWAHAHGRA